MKKVLAIISVIVLSAVLFAGCGVSGNTTVVSVGFTNTVFYVDAGCATPITYEAYPSTAKDYRANLIPDHEGGYELKDGVITITDAMSFTPLTLTLKVGDMEDVCYVARKVYPTRTFIYHNDMGKIGTGENEINPADDIAYNTVREIVLLAGQSTKLSLYGEFLSYFDVANRKMETYGDSLDRFQEISPEMFIFKMESSNPNLVRVSDDGKNLTISANDKTGSATITIYLVNTNGEIVDSVASGNGAKVNVRVIDSCENSFVTYNGERIEPESENLGDNNESDLVYHYVLGINSIMGNSSSLYFDLYLLNGENDYVEDSLVLESLRLAVVGEHFAPDHVQNNNISVSGGIVSGDAVPISRYRIRISNSSSNAVDVNASDKLIITSRYLLDNKSNVIRVIISLNDVVENGD